MTTTDAQEGTFAMAQRLASTLRGAQTGWGPATASRDFVMIRTFMAASGKREVTVPSVHRQPVPPGVTEPTGPPPPEIGPLPRQCGAARVAKHGFVLSASVTQRPAPSSDVEQTCSSAAPWGAAPVVISARQFGDPSSRGRISIVLSPTRVGPKSPALEFRESNRVGWLGKPVEEAACHERPWNVGHRSDDRPSDRGQTDDVVVSSPEVGRTRHRNETMNAHPAVLRPFATVVDGFDVAPPACGPALQPARHWRSHRSSSNPFRS